MSTFGSLLRGGDEHMDRETHCKVVYVSRSMVGLGMVIAAGGGMLLAYNDVVWLGGFVVFIGSIWVFLTVLILYKYRLGMRSRALVTVTSSGGGSGVETVHDHHHHHHRHRQSTTISSTRRGSCVSVISGREFAHHHHHHSTRRSLSAVWTRSSQWHNNSTIDMRLQLDDHRHRQGGRHYPQQPHQRVPTRGQEVAAHGGHDRVIPDHQPVDNGWMVEPLGISDQPQPVQRPSDNYPTEPQLTRSQPGGFPHQPYPAMQPPADGYHQHDQGRYSYPVEADQSGPGPSGSHGNEPPPPSYEDAIRLPDKR